MNAASDCVERNDDVMTFTTLGPQSPGTLTTGELHPNIANIGDNMEESTAHPGVPRSMMRNVFPLMLLIGIYGCGGDHEPADDAATASSVPETATSAQEPESATIAPTEAPTDAAPSADVPIEAEPEADVLSKGPDDIALECRFADRDGPTKVLIYSPTYGMKEMLSEVSDGKFEMEYRIRGISSTTSYVTFDVASSSALVARALNPSVTLEPESLTIDRESLTMRYRTDSKYGGLLTWDYKCDLLSDVKFAMHVQTHLDYARRLKEAEEAQKSRNKI